MNIELSILPEDTSALKQIIITQQTEFQKIQKQNSFLQEMVRLLKNELFTPAKLRVIRHIRLKYACKDCEGVEDDGSTVNFLFKILDTVVFLNASESVPYQF